MGIAALKEAELAFELKYNSLLVLFCGLFVCLKTNEIHIMEKAFNR